MSASRKFDVEVVKAWRARVIAGESYASVAPSGVSGNQVYYHVNKLGSLKSMPSREIRLRRAVTGTFEQRVRRLDPVPTFASELAKPSLAARMAGRARIPRRIDRLEGVEA